MSMKDVSTRVTRIRFEDISKVAAQGVGRALEARIARGIELTEDEVDHVGGGYGEDFATVGYAPPPFLSSIVPDGSGF